MIDWRPRVAVAVFPGSNDDRDAALALEHLGAEPVLVWHAESRLPDVGAVVLPGGFSYGDYLRCGAIARFAPAMAAVREFASEGGPVLGICNGFQILCEAGLLPGVLRPNDSLEFVCRDVEVIVEHAGPPFLSVRGGLVDTVTGAVRAIAGITPELSTSGGTSDGRFLADVSREVIEFGPISASIHGIDEHVALADIAPLSQIYERVLASLLKPA